MFTFSSSEGVGKRHKWFGWNLSQYLDNLLLHILHIPLLAPPGALVVMIRQPTIFTAAQRKPTFDISIKPNASVTILTTYRYYMINQL